MFIKKFVITVIFVLSSSHISCSGRSILCIDGGGSKTALQVINAQGVVLPLTKHDITTNTVEAGGSNINTVGSDGVKQVLSDLFNHTKIDNGKVIRDILPTCYIVASMAGVGSIDNKNAVIKIFEEWGVQKDCLLLTSDAELALQLLPGNGAILIAGTGSICLGKKNNRRYRVGGLGYLLGDEGSGYFIGLQALKVALAHEYGWGKPTSLTAELCKLYCVTSIKEVMQALYRGKISPAKIGSVAPTVLAQALAQDAQARAIVDLAAIQLCDLVTTMATIADLSECEVHAWGGLFKSETADFLMKKIKQHPVILQRRINLVNQARQNPATLFAQKTICMDSKSQSNWQAAQKLLAS